LYPAPSIVFFTTASGAGYGLLVFASLTGLLGLVPITAASGVILLAPALGLVGAGLLSSTLHLGHPERAWRAFSQWRSSWLSREGVAAVATLLPALVLAWLWVTAERLAPVPALTTVLLSLVTIYCTAMIYASLQPIPRWHHPLVPPVYLALGLATGTLLGLALAAWLGDIGTLPRGLGLLLLSTAWALKWRYWQAIDGAKPRATTADAIGLAARGPARLTEAPNTERNYILNEMGFQIARRHKAKLRRHALTAGWAIPAAALLLSFAAGERIVPVILTFGAIATLFGTLVERWLFFAEAEHLVMLYYGRASV
jgi:sulfite dehydrogenase (quinone) subunit SoeC